MLGLIVHEIGDASIIHVENPSILPIIRLRGFVQIRKYLLDNHFYITAILPPQHVLLNVANALGRNGMKAPDVVGLDPHPPAEAVAGVKHGGHGARGEPGHFHCGGLREEAC